MVKFALNSVFMQVRSRKGRFDLFVGFRIAEFRTKAEFQRSGRFFSSTELFYEFKFGAFIPY